MSTPATTPAPTAASATAAASLLDQASSVITDAEELLHGAAETLNWAWEWFEPGQGWRIAFGAGAVILGYLGLRQWGIIPPVSPAAKAP